MLWNKAPTIEIVADVLESYRLARMLWNKAPTIEIDADVLENYPSFTADININETDKNIKQKVFDRIINQLRPDNDTVYIDHDKKYNNKFRVRQEMPDKNIKRKSSRKKLKRA